MKAIVETTAAFFMNFSNLFVFDIFKLLRHGLPNRANRNAEELAVRINSSSKAVFIL